MFKQGIDQLTLFGVLGKRTDHLLYTLSLLSRFPEKLTIRSESELIFAIQKNQAIRVTSGQTLSLIPMGIVKSVTTKGLKWEINDQVIG